MEQAYDKDLTKIWKVIQRHLLAYFHKICQLFKFSDNPNRKSKVKDRKGWKTVPRNIKVWCVGGEETSPFSSAVLS